MKKALLFFALILCVCVSGVYGQISITVTPHDATAKFNGDLHTLSTDPHTVAVSGGSLRVGDYIAEVTMDSAYFLAGVYTVTLKSVVIKDASDQDVTSDYDITLGSNTLTVQHREESEKFNISPQCSDQNETYSGTLIEFDGWNTTQFEIDGHKFYMTGFDIHMEGTDVGEYLATTSGTPTIWMDTLGYHFDVTEEFKVTPNKGKLVIAQKPLSIFVDSTRLYDGNPFVVDYSKVEAELAAGDHFTSGSVTTSSANVGVYRYSDNACLISTPFETANGIGNYYVTYVFDLTINKLPVTDTVRGAIYVGDYDGTEHSVSTFTHNLSNTTLYNTSYITNPAASAVTATRMVHGTTYMGMRPSQFQNTNDNFDVTFRIEDGYVQIDRIGPIQITTASDEKYYDKEWLKNPGFTYTGTLLAGDELTTVMKDSILNAGRKNNQFESYKVMRGSVDVTDCYNFDDPIYGQLKIKPIDIYITTKDSTRMYDGTPLSAPVFTITSGHYVGTDTMIPNFANTYIVDPGQKLNGYEVTYGPGTLPENYLIHNTFGTLKVTDSLRVAAMYFAVSCHDGTTSLNIYPRRGHEGQAPYQYQLNDGEWTPMTGFNAYVNGLQAGVQNTVRMKDALGVVDSVKYTPYNPPQLVIDTIYVTDADCGKANGKASAEVSGGTMVDGQYYFYNWSTGAQTPEITDLAQGDSYSLTVRDFYGCSVTKPFEVKVGRTADVHNFEHELTCLTEGEYCVTPVDGSNGYIPAGTTYSWGAPEIIPSSAASGISGTTTGSGESTICTGHIVNASGVLVRVRYHVTPSNPSCGDGHEFYVDLLLGGHEIVAESISISPQKLSVCGNTGAPLDTALTVNLSTLAGSNPYPIHWIMGHDTTLAYAHTGDVKAEFPIILPDTCAATFAYRFEILDNNGCWHKVDANYGLTAGSWTLGETPEVKVVACAEEAQAPDVAGLLPVVTTSCGNTVPWTHSSYATGNNCDMYINHMYTYKDCRDSSATINYRFHVKDTIAPTTREDYPRVVRAPVYECVFTIPSLIDSIRPLHENCQNGFTFYTQNPSPGEVITEDTEVVLDVMDACNNHRYDTILVVVDDSIRVTADAYDSRCYDLSDGYIEGHFSGGVPPYDIVWTSETENGAIQKNAEGDFRFDELPDGKYQITIVGGNGCKSADTVKLNLQDYDIPVIVRAKSGAREYNGFPYELNEYELDTNLLRVIDGHRDVADVTIEGSITNVGTTDNRVTSVTIWRGAIDVTCEYNLSKVNGTLRVNKRVIKLKSDDAVKNYDGTPLTAEHVSIVEGSFPTGTTEGIDSYANFGSRTLVGHEENDFTYTLNSSTDANNYDITKQFGILEVKKTVKKITIKALDSTRNYDCYPLVQPRYSVNTENLFPGDTVIATTSGSQTLVGVAFNVISSYKIINKVTSEDVTSCYTINPTQVGKLTVKARPITITAGSKYGIPYHGAEHTWEEIPLAERYTVAPQTVNDSLADCDHFTAVSLMGSGTIVGTYPTYVNLSSMVIEDGSGNVRTGNYAVTTVNGHLEIVDRIPPYELVIVAHGDTVDYTGAPQTCQGFDTVIVNGVTYVWGGATDLNFTLINENGDHVSYRLEGASASVTQTNAGVYPVNVVLNSPKIYDSGNHDVSDQFHLTARDATFVIKRLGALKIIVVDEKPYDATPLTTNWNSHTTAPKPPLGSADYLTAGAMTTNGADIGTYTYSWTPGEAGKSHESIDYNTHGGIANYNGIEYDVTQTITIGVTMQAKCPSGTDITKMYDGTPLAPTGSVLNAPVHDGAAFTYSYRYEDSPGHWTAWSWQVPEITHVGTLNAEMKVENVHYKADSCTYTLTVTPRNVTLTSATSSKEYDQTDLCAQYITITGDGFATDEGLADTIVPTCIRNVVDGSVTSKADNPFTYTLKSNTDPGDYVFTNVVGKLWITPRPVTITSADSTHAYATHETQPAEKHFAKVTSPKGFLGGDTVSYTDWGSQLIPGFSDNSFDTTNFTHGTDATSTKENYAITKVYGTLTVTDTYELIVSSQNDTFQYNGRPHYGTKFTVTLNGVEMPNVAGVDTCFYLYGDAAHPENINMLTITRTANITNVNQSPVVSTFTYTITHGTQNIIDCYPVRTKLDTGKLFVTPIPLLVTVNDTKEYDGTVLTTAYNSTHLTATGFATGTGVNDHFVAGEITTNEDTVHVYTYSETVDGLHSSVTTPFVIKNASGAVINDNYIILYDVTQTITPSDDYTLTCPSGSSITKVYDGTALNPTAAVTGQYSGDVLTIEYSTDGGSNWSTTQPSITHVSQSISEVKVRATHHDYVTKNCSYSLTITKRNVKPTSASDTKVYDNTPLTNSTVTTPETGIYKPWVSGEEATYTVTGTQTEVGSSKNDFDFTWDASADHDDYIVTLDSGVLKVTPSPALEVYCPGTTENTAAINKTYDGTALNPSATFNNTGLYGSDAASVVIEYKVGTGAWSTTAPSVTHYVDGPKTVKVRATHHDYDTATCSYTLTISKRPIEITSADSTQVYNRTENRKEVTSVTSGSFVGTESFTYSNWTGRTNVGTQDNTFKFAPGAGTDTNDYTVTRVYGTLEVTPSPLAVVTCPSGNAITKKYDGTPLAPTASATGISPDVVPVQYATSASGPWQNDPISITNVGTQQVYVRTNNPNYQEKTCDYVLTDTCRHITLTSQDSTRKYNGNAMEAHRITVGGDGFVTGEVFAYSNYASITEVGSKSNTFDYATGTANTSNYCVDEVINGTLTITRAPLAIKCPGSTGSTNSNTKIYDGQMFSPTVDTIGLIGTDAATLQYSIDGGAWSTTLPSIKHWKDSIDNIAVRAIHADYDTAKCSYDLKIQKRPVRVLSGSGEKVYDKTALVNHDAPTVVSGYYDWATGEAATYSITGSQTDVGQSKNDFTYTLHEDAMASDYIVKLDSGLLKVTPSPNLVVECPGTSANPAAVTKMYDGTKLNPAADTSGLYAGDKATLEYSVDGGSSWADTIPYITHVGTKTVKVRATHPNYDTDECTYTLTVNCRHLTLTSKSKTQEYDGTTWDYKYVDITGDGMADGEHIDSTNFPTIKDVGSKSNTFDYTFVSPAQAGDYCVDAVNYGMLTVTRAHLTVDCPSGTAVSKDYDGDSLRPAATSSGIISPDVAIVEYSTDGGTVWKTEVPGIINAGTLSVKVRVREENANYDTATCNYELEINPITSAVVVTITGHNGEFGWDGNPHTVTGYDATSDTPLYTAVMDTSVHYAGDSSVTRTDIGTDPMVLVEAHFTNGNPNFTNVSFVVINGSIKIADTEKPKFVIGCATIGNKTVLPTELDNSYHHTGTDWDATATDNYDTPTVDSLYYILTGATEFSGPYTSKHVSLNDVYFQLGVTTVTWVAKDAAGNDTTCTFTVTVEDATPPTINCPKDTLVMCQSDVPAYVTTYAEFETIGGSATDNVGIVESTFEWRNDIPDGVDCHDTIRRTYAISDAMSNTGTCVQKIVVKDTIKPTFTVPADLALCRNDLTGEIEADIAVTGVMLDTADNCLTPAQLHAGWRDLDTTGTDATIRVIHREWYLADTCGDTTKKVQNITIYPSLRTPGNLNKMCPSDTTIVLLYGECDTAILLPHPAFVNHMTGSNVTVGKDIADDYRYGAETSTTVTWVYTDDCGATDTCFQKVTVHYPPCGTPGDSVADYEGNKYSSVRIGCYCWTGENLRSTKYSDGTDIDTYYSYKYSDSLENIYGKLYSWYSAARVPEGDDAAVPADSAGPRGPYVQGICPEGWALPTMEEYARMVSDAGDVLEKIKDATPGYWVEGSEGTTPNSGFDARGGGKYDAPSMDFEGLMVAAYFWTLTNTSTSHMMVCGTVPNSCAPLEMTPTDKRSGCSIRCIRKK